MLLLKFKILGHSMEPEIRSGQKVIVSNLPYFFKKPKVNDIVAVEYKKEVLIKRITRLNSNEVFIQGDNQKDSLDSKRFGFINRNKILGKVIYKM